MAGCEEHEGDDDAPMITTDRVRPHPDRGPCVRCHVVLPGAGIARAAPPITVDLVRPHPDRGRCSGCHVVRGL
jgi:hypothetical protein